MRLLLSFILLFCLCMGYSRGNPAGMGSASPPSLSFIENKGQVHDQFHKARLDVLFSGYVGNLVYHLRKDGISYQFSRVESWSEIEDLKPKLKRKVPDSVTIYRLDMHWINCRRQITPIADAELPGSENYYMQNCPSGALNVKTFKGVTVKDIYDGISIHFYGKTGALKYDYLVKPHANYKQIKTLVSGATKIRLQADGSILLSTPLGQIQEAAPQVFQNHRELKSRWHLDGDTLSFEIDDYDPALPLLIDPIVRDWATYYGDNAGDNINCVKVDLSGNVYVSGTTSSTVSIATSGAHQTIWAGGINYTGDAYLVKFNSSGVRQWSTYYGGNGTENGMACAVDGLGNVYLTGYSNTGYNGNGGTVIATPGSYISTYTTGTNGFLVKFNSLGVR